MSLTREELIAAEPPERELEAAIWHTLTHFKVSVANGRAVVDALIAVTRAYAAGDGEQVTAARRAVLAGHGFASLILCDSCYRSHFRSMPIGRSNSCLKIPCQCWCGDRDDKPLEVD